VLSPKVPIAGLNLIWTVKKKGPKIDEILDPNGPEVSLVYPGQIFFWMLFTCIQRVIFPDLAPIERYDRF
jgi:hypothetical protein